MSTPFQISFQAPTNDPIQQYLSIQGQSIYDIVMQTYQNPEMLLTLLKDNGFTYIPTGQIGVKYFIFDTRKVKNLPLVIYNFNTNTIYKTAFDDFNPELRDDYSYDLEDDGTISMRD